MKSSDGAQKQPREKRATASSTTGFSTIESEVVVVTSSGANARGRGRSSRGRPHCWSGVAGASAKHAIGCRQLLHLMTVASECAS